MKNKKILWLSIGVAVLAAAVILSLVLTKEDRTSESDTSATSRATITWPTREPTTKPTHFWEASHGDEDEDETSEAAIGTAPHNSFNNIPSYHSCRSIGIGGGEFYYAIGYKEGDESMKKLVAEGLAWMEKKGIIQKISYEWFIDSVYCRDTKRDIHGSVDEELAKKLKENGVKVGVLDGNAPVASFHDGKAEGFEIDIAKSCFEQIGLEPTFVSVTQDGVAEALESGEVDLVWGGLRADSVKNIDYSAINEWNLENEMCYYTMYGKRYHGEKQLLDQEGYIGVIRDSLCESFFVDRLKNADVSAETKEFASAADAFTAMKSDDIYCVACDYLTALAMWKQG